MTIFLGKRVLLTGGSGFIGRHAIDSLLGRGFEVHVVGRRPLSSGLATRVTWHASDLLKEASHASLIETIRPTHLLHLAWCTAHGNYWTSEENLDWVRATLSLVRCFAGSGGKRLVCAGTCAEYDWTGEHCREDHTPTRPATLYGAAKNGLRDILEKYATTQNLSQAWGRLFCLYGPDEDPRRLVPSILLPLAQGEPGECNYGDHVRDFLHAADAADGLVALLDSTIAGPVNIASGEPVRLGHLSRLLADYLGRPDLLRVHTHDPPSAANPAVLTADVRRLGSAVGWTPRVSLQQGLKELCRARGRRSMLRSVNSVEVGSSITRS